MVKRVGKYEMGRTLGEGTFGKVKHAINTETNEAVAIKVLDKEKIQKQNMGNQIKKEISIMKMVNHKYIVEMIEVLASKTKIFIVLELVTGGELFDKIVSMGRMSEEQALFYFGQLVEGVEYCHKNGVCHRDLKPENLLLDQHGNLKISDFGLSSLYVGDADSDGVSRTQILHTTCGTPNYVAPEVLADQGYDGKKADVWSIGVILYVLLAGFLPFDESTIVQLFAKIQSAQFSYPAWFSSEARAVIDVMLVADPKARISLAQLKEIPWVASRTQHVPDGVVQSSQKASAAAAPSVEHEHSDEDEARGVRHLNAFELVSQCGGFRIDRMFNPRLHCTVEQGNEVDAGASNSTLDGLLRFGATSRSPGKFNFTSNVGLPDLIVGLFEAVVGMGCEVLNGVENCVATGKIRATKLTPKGMVAMVVQVFTLCQSLNLVAVTRGKGDILEWNNVYQELVENRIAHLINKTAEGEAKSAR